MIMRFVRWMGFLAVVGLGAFYYVTIPETVSDEELVGLEQNPENGRTTFIAAGCASCHSAPQAGRDEKLILSGGRKFPSPFGTFFAPNISQDELYGIGGWSQTEFVTAVTKGTGPKGQHYFPAFPYGSYNKMSLQDGVDLFAYMNTLQADATPSQEHDVGFPFNIRRSLGGWKMLFASTDWQVDATDPALIRGRYLVEALGHCAECHTPRNFLGGMNRDQWMQGAPDPSGEGRIPPITSSRLGWSKSDIAEYLKSGFTPDFDSAGSHMVDVIANTSQLNDEDRKAIAAYLVALQ